MIKFSVIAVLLLTANAAFAYAPRPTQGHHAHHQHHAHHAHHQQHHHRAARR